MAESTRDVPASDSKRSEARTQGYQAPTGVFKTLIAQHERVRALLERVRSANDAGSRGEIWTEARRQLLTHERAEELEVYAALEGDDAARDIMAEHSREVRDLEFVIGELDIIDYASDEWTAHLLEVAALFDEHAREEEGTLFPAAQQLLGEQRALELEGRFESAYRETLDTLA